MNFYFFIFFSWHPHQGCIFNLLFFLSTHAIYYFCLAWLFAYSSTSTSAQFESRHLLLLVLVHYASHDLHQIWIRLRLWLQMIEFDREKERIDRIRTRATCTPWERSTSRPRRPLTYEFVCVSSCVCREIRIQEESYYTACRTVVEFAVGAIKNIFRE